MTLHGTPKQEHGNPAQGAQANEPLQPGQEGTPPGQEGTPEIDEAKQYSGADVRKLLSADGRTQKDRAEAAEANLRLISGEHETLKTQFNTVSGQVDQLLKAQNDAELEKYSEDKPAQDSIRARQANRAEKIRLEGVEATNQGREAKFAERETALAQKEISINIKLAAMAASVDEVELADLVPDGNPARLKKAADILKKRGPAGNQPFTPAGLRNRPASAVSAGTGPQGLSPDEKIQYGLNQKKK